MSVVQHYYSYVVVENNRISSTILIVDINNKHRSLRINKTTDNKSWQIGKKLSVKITTENGIDRYQYCNQKRWLKLQVKK